MVAQELPLIDLFNSLRQHGLPLGIDDYLLLLKAIQAGFYIDNSASLQKLCCTLWAKSDVDIQLIKRLFPNLLWPSKTVISEDNIKPEGKVNENLPQDNFTSMDYPSTKQDEVREHKKESTPLENELDEPLQIVQAFRKSTFERGELLRPSFLQINEYFPVTKRQMKRGWRNLRQMVREGLTDKIDVNATVKLAAQQGVINSFVYLHRRQNKAKLTLLVDVDGSMAPFHMLTKQLLESVSKGGHLGGSSIYYFHDYPDDYLYLDRARLYSISMNDFISNLNEKLNILIISDAGSARGHLDQERISKTITFLRKLRQSVSFFAWLNPMPKARWKNNTAEDISKEIPMFEMSRSGLDSAINALRGRFRYTVPTY